MIARPKISQNEWKTAEILSCPVERLADRALDGELDGVEVGHEGHVAGGQSLEGRLELAELLHGLGLGLLVLVVVELAPELLEVLELDEEAVELLLDGRLHARRLVDAARRHGAKGGAAGAKKRLSLGGHAPGAAARPVEQSR